MQIIDRQSQTGAPAAWRVRCRAAGVLVAAAAAMAMPAAALTALMFGPASALVLAALWGLIALAAGLCAALLQGGDEGNAAGAFQARCLRWAGNLPPAATPPPQAMRIVRSSPTPAVRRRADMASRVAGSVQRDGLKAA